MANQTLTKKHVLLIKEAVETYINFNVSINNPQLKEYEDTLKVIESLLIQT